MKRMLLAIIHIFFVTFSFGQHDHSQHSSQPSMSGNENTDTIKQIIKPTGKTVEYDLYINDTILPSVSKNIKALTVNGFVPGPTLYFTLGDTAVIRVHNQIKKEETSVHWHGILLPNEQDGVPNLTTAPIKPGTTHTFKFPLIQTGTYWFHSHTSLQEQVGTYGSIVIYPPNFVKGNEKVILLSDWIDQKPYQVFRNLKRASDWYGVRKDAVQSWGEALAKGYLGDRFKTEWNRMPAMDVSDVYYDKFLLNGKTESEYTDVKPGETVRLRIINGAATSYFWLQFAGGKMRVIAADGIDVVPFDVDRLMIAIAETYDVEVTLPNDKMSYELRATSIDMVGHSSLFLGYGMKMKTADLPKLDYFAMMRQMNKMGHGRMNMGGKDIDEMDHSKMDQKGDSKMKMDKKMEGEKEKDQIKKPHKSDTADKMIHDHKSMSPGNKDNPAKDEIVFNYNMLRSPFPTKLNQDQLFREVPLTLTGNMLRYVWSFNSIPLSKSDKILIKKGENVRFTLINNTMMRHPLHLHGHFFRFVNAQDDYSPMKHTFDIQPMEKVVIEFYANEEKDWFFHCHILYHMMAGMARVVSYENSPPNEQVSEKDKIRLFHEDRIWWYWGITKIATNGVYGEARYSNNFNSVGLEYRLNYKGEFELQPDYERYIDNHQFLSIYGGADIRNSQEDNGDAGTSFKKRRVAVAGVRYLLPLFVESELRVDHNGRVRFQLKREDMPLSRRIRLSMSANTDKEYNIDFDYLLLQYLTVHASYDSDYKYGAGLTFLW
jgi:CopA family copper-resistance protein